MLAALGSLVTDKYPFVHLKSKTERAEVVGELTDKFETFLCPGDVTVCRHLFFPPLVLNVHSRLHAHFTEGHGRV